MLIAMLVYPVTGFAVAFCLYFLHAAWQGWQVDFSPYAVNAHGIVASVVWFALVGPIVCARIAHLQLIDAEQPSTIGAIFGFAITLFWAAMLGMLCQELSHIALV
ncbi:MAG: hypothetical protein AAFR71_08220 [Pseudomonadota bacterium]